MNGKSFSFGPYFSNLNKFIFPDLVFNLLPVFPGNAMVG